MTAKIQMYNSIPNDMPYNEFGWYFSSDGNTVIQSGKPGAGGIAPHEKRFETGTNSTSCYGSNESLSTSSWASNNFRNYRKTFQQNKTFQLYHNTNKEEIRDTHLDRKYYPINFRNGSVTETSYSDTTTRSNEADATEYGTAKGDSSPTHLGNKENSNYRFGPTQGRWFVLIVVCLSVSIRSFVSVVFGQINDIFSAYFQVEPSSIDWLTNAGSLATLFSIIVMAVTGQKSFNLRPLCLYMTGTASVGTILLTWAMTDSRRGYVISLIGQIFMGINNAIVMTIPPLVTTTWFPSSEISTALAFILIFVGIGEALGSYLPGVVIFPSDNPLFSDQELSGDFDSGEDLQFEKFEEITSFRLVLLFLFTAGISIILFVLMISFLKEKPTMPPSYADHWLRRLQNFKKSRRNEHRNRLESYKSNASDTNCSITTSVYNTYQTSKSLSNLIKDKLFILTATLYGVVASSASTSITLLSSMIRIGFSEAENSDELSGKIMTAMWVFFVIGSFITGRILDKTRSYRKMTIVGIFGVTMGCLGISISLYNESILGLYVAHLILGISMGSAETSLFEAASEITYPAPALSFATLLTGFWMVFFVAYPVSGRFLLNNIQDMLNFQNISINVVVALSSCVPAIGALACFCLTAIFFHPKLRRSKRAKNYTTLRGHHF